MPGTSLVYTEAQVRGPTTTTSPIHSAQVKPSQSPPPHPQVGSLGHPHGSTATVTCEAGFERSGDAPQATCHQSRVFQPQLGLCCEDLC